MSDSRPVCVHWVGHSLLQRLPAAAAAAAPAAEAAAPLQSSLVVRLRAPLQLCCRLCSVMCLSYHATDSAGTDGSCLSAQAAQTLLPLTARTSPPYTHISA